MKNWKPMLMMCEWQRRDDVNIYFHKLGLIKPSKGDPIMLSTKNYCSLLTLIGIIYLNSDKEINIFLSVSLPLSPSLNQFLNIVGLSSLYYLIILISWMRFCLLFTKWFILQTIQISVFFPPKFIYCIQVYLYINTYKYLYLL